MVLLKYFLSLPNFLSSKKQANLLKINNKVAVITGAGSGIGKQLALQLADAGATVVISDYNAQTLAETYALIVQNGGHAHQYVVNVSDRAEVYAFANNVLNGLQQVDIVINNAGIALGRVSVADVSYNDFEAVMNVNFWGMVYGTKAFLPALAERPEASLVNVSSLFGITGIAYQSAYCTSKFAIRGFTESLRMEAKALYPNLTVTLVHPGGIQTNIARDARLPENIEIDEETQRKQTAAFERFFRTSAETAAKQIIKGIQKGKQRILIGSEAFVGDGLVRLFPVRYTNIMGRTLRQFEDSVE